MSISRPVCVAVSAIVIALGVSACGSDSNSNSSSTAGAGANPPGNGQRGFLQDPKVVACLKKQGVTLPSRSRGNGGPPNGGNGQPPTGTDGQPPTGTNRRPPSGQGAPNGPGSAQFQKLRAALQKCGVDFRGQPPNGQAPQGQGTTTPSAS